MEVVVAEEPVTVMVCTVETLPCAPDFAAKTAFTLCEPMPGINLIDAVPTGVSWAVPRTAGPSQKVAVESQKVTKPAVTGLPETVTVAVKVTAVPAETLEDEVLNAVTLAGGMA